jgi:hypothetical protein
MIILHDHTLKLYFGIGDLVIGAEVQVKLFRKCQVIRSPYRFVGRVIYKVQLEVVDVVNMLEIAALSISYF